MRKVPLVLASLVLLAPAAAVRGAAAAPGPCPADPFSLSLRALTAADGTELTMRLASSTAACELPSTLKSIQVKTFSSGGVVARVENETDLPSPAGTASMELGPLEHGQRIEVKALVQTEQTVRTLVLSSKTAVLLRPDLTVRLAAPRQVLVERAFDVEATVAEVNADVGATATATLTSAGTELGSKPVEVAAGGRVAVTFPVTLHETGAARLEVTISNADPREANVANNQAPATVEATEVALAPQQVLVGSLAGYGGQFNQHVYAKLSMPPVTEQNVVDMEQKVVALHPQLVRIFFSNTAIDPKVALATRVDRMNSFIRTVLLAQRAGSTINVTWQGGGTVNPEFWMSGFANALIDLVKNRGVTNLRWVTIQNEVNSTAITMQQNELAYRLVDKYFRDAGVRDQLRFMGGDLVLTNQRAWFNYMATHMADLLDAWSIHVFWDYWDTPKIESRLAGVRAIWDSEPPTGRKPLYVTEYGVRGDRHYGGVLQIEPGLYEDGTPMTQTNINAFQHAWFTLRSAQLGFLGCSKWDSYWGKYDSGTQAVYMIGSPLDGWPLYPVYWITRLFTLTTQPGWKVVGFDGDARGKVLAAYAGSAGELTIVGLHPDGATLNTASATSVPYSIGGLPPSTPFHLVFWNRDGNGTLSSVDLASDDAGVVRLEAPLSGVFALTTLPVEA